MPDVGEVMYIEIGDVAEIMNVEIGDVGQIMGHDVSLSRGSLISQGTGARYNFFGGGTAWPLTHYSGYSDKIQVANPANSSDYTHTGDLHRGLAAVATAGNGSRIIASLGWSSTTSETANFTGWDQDGTSGPYVDDVIEYLDSSSGGDAQDFGDVHYYELGYPPVGSSNIPSASEDGSARFHFGAPAAGRDGATGYFAGGSGRWSPGRAFTDKVLQRAIGSTGNTSYWGSDLDQWWSWGQTGLEGYTGSPSTLDTRWIIARGFYRAGAGSNALGSADVYVQEIRYFTFASASTGTDFGDQASTYQFATRMAGMSNGDRGLIVGGANQWDVAGGGSPGTDDCGTAGDTGGAWQYGAGNTISYITIASAGNACNFGDLIETTSAAAGEVANGTYGEYCGGQKRDARPNDHTGYSSTDVCNKITLASTGNATDHRNCYEATGGDGGSTGQAGSN